jgi:hypothetical protein
MDFGGFGRGIHPSEQHDPAFGTTRQDTAKIKEAWRQPEMTSKTGVVGVSPKPAESGMIPPFRDIE